MGKDADLVAGMTPRTEAGKALLDEAGFKVGERCYAFVLHGIAAVEEEARADSTEGSNAAIADMERRVADAEAQALALRQALDGHHTRGLACDRPACIAPADRPSVKHRLLMPPHPDGFYLASALCSCGKWQWDGRTPAEVIAAREAVVRDHANHVAADRPSVDASAVRRCDHRNVVNTLYMREWQCQDCGRYFDRTTKPKGGMWDYF